MSAARWSPDAYLADGLFCPTGQIARRVRQWRAAHHHSWVLLLPFPAATDATAYGSLMIYADAQSDRDGGVQHKVADATTKSSARHLSESLRELVDAAEDANAGAIPATLAAQLRSTSIVSAALAANGGAGHPLRLIRPARWSTDEGVRFFCLVDGSGVTGPDDVVERADDLGELQTMLNGSRQAALHQHERHRYRARTAAAPESISHRHMRIEDFLPDERYAGLDNHHIYEDLLADATIIDPRAVVALYLVDRYGAHLVRTASIGTGDGYDEIALDPERSSIAFVVERNRPPRVANRVVGEPSLHSTMRSAWLGRKPAPADFSEIVVPILSTAVGSRSSVIGALVVQRRSRTHDEVFDAMDLEFLEQLSYRISLRRSNLVFREATETLAELTGQAVMPSAGAGDLSKLEPCWSALPIDHANARPWIRRTAQLVYRLVPCTQVAVALIDTHQRDLVVVASLGDDHGLPESWPIRLSGSGLAALASVAVTRGRTAIVRDSRDNAAFKEFDGQVGRAHWPADVRTAHATPIMVADRSVGVLLIAASRKDVLTSGAGLLEAIGQQINLSLILAQRAEERRAFAIASSTALHAHEILKRVDELRRLDSHGAAAIADQIERLVDVMRAPERGPELLGSDVIDAIRDAVADVGLADFVVWDDDLPTLPPVPATVSLAVRRAATEVFRNSKIRMDDAEDAPYITIRARVEHRAQLPRVVVEMQHTVANPIDPRILPWLYRAPIDDDAAVGGRRHFGAFTAGYWLRAVGGDVYLWRCETDRNGRHWVGTAFEVPILTLTPEGAPV